MIKPARSKGSTNELKPDTATHHLSVLRLLVLICIIGLLGYGGFASVKAIVKRYTDSYKPWFAAYVDVTSTPAYPFQQLGSTKTKDAILSFVVDLPGSSCTPAWGGVYTLDEATNILNLDQRIVRLQQQGGSVAISFGGKKNQELAVTCDNVSALTSAYASVINRYHVNTIDFDIEGQDLNNTAANQRRVEAIRTLQTTMQAKGKKLAVWLTLPVTPQGLPLNATSIILEMLNGHINLAGVNIMTMDYGSSLTGGQTILSASENAMTQTVRQLGILYRMNHLILSDTVLWSKLGVTPMIGQNDTLDEIFSLADARALNQFAQANGAGRMSMWSANRDIACSSNYPDWQIVSNSCSGVRQAPQQYADILDQGFGNRMTFNSHLVTNAQLNQEASLPDNPATSPYPIWTPDGAYPTGYKVVWHHNIYEAKWWTQGNVPDDPVLESWQTPWQLIGPVLPGEKPAQLPTLPPGTYPDWSGTTIYQTGQRVLFNQVPYQAKWWNQGDSPAAVASDPSGSPWEQLTVAQVNAIKAGLQ